MAEFCGYLWQNALQVIWRGSMLEYVSYQNGKPQKLVIFLHGYNGTISDHQYAIDWLRQKINDAVLVVPSAPEISDKNPQKKQWFGMLRYDADNKRAQAETTAEQIFNIYDTAGNEVQKCAQTINNFIDDMQKKYRIDNAHTYLAGFSQGAMLTIYTALSRAGEIAGAFSLSGLVAGKTLLDKDIKSLPRLFLFHGQDDMKVQYKTLPQSIRWLKDHQVNISSKTYPELAHKICPEEIEDISQTINSL